MLRAPLDQLQDVLNTCTNNGLIRSTPHGDERDDRDTFSYWRIHRFSWAIGRLQDDVLRTDFHDSFVDKFYGQPEFWRPGAVV